MQTVASNSKMSGLIRPKIELDRAFMPVLVTGNKFDDDSIKNERASMETTFSYYQDQESLLVRRRNDNHSPGPVIRELVPSSHQKVNLATQSSASSADEISESGRAFQSLIVWGKKLPL